MGPSTDKEELLYEDSRRSTMRRSSSLSDGQMPSGVGKNNLALDRANSFNVARSSSDFADIAFRESVERKRLISQKLRQELIGRK